MKHALRKLSMLVLLAGLLVACGPAEPEVITVEVPGPGGETIIVTATPAPTTGEVEEEPAVTFERSETLYTGGTMWSPPSSWNPYNWGNYATGSVGLLYETLFIYDPLTNEYIPWLAESGEWTSDTVYEVKVRQGVTWSDGEPLTAEDVKFSFDLAQEAPVVISTVWTFLDSVEVTDEVTVQFTFSQALYQQWAFFLYNAPIVPQHIWGSMSVEEITTGANENPVGTGPYLYESHDQTRMVWVKNENWWAKEALGLDPKPKRIVDIVNSSNNVSLGLVLQGGEDLNNNFLPGVATLVKGGYGVQTYYPEPPYMLAANTAWLSMNSTIKPMDDPAFRRAMAYAIDTDQIVNVVYGNLVEKANPTGLLPMWDEYVDQDVVDELGFSYDPDQAKQILADAGYVDTDGDGFVEAPDGSKIELSVMVPNGWTDWMESIRVIANGAQAVGINLTPEFPDYGTYLATRLDGTFEMAIDNQAQLSNTPWTYYDWLFQNPLEDIATIQNGNYGRYDNQAAFDLVDQLDQVPIDDLEGMQAIISQLQTIMLTDMPVIPLWYNGMWSQTSNSVWTNWPSSVEGANHYLPTTWRGYWNMTAILMLCELEPAASE